MFSFASVPQPNVNAHHFGGHINFAIACFWTTLPLKLYWIGPPGCFADRLDNRMAIVAPSHCQIELPCILLPFRLHSVGLWHIYIYIYIGIGI